jgi:hypothetical protein
MKQGAGCCTTKTVIKNRECPHGPPAPGARRWLPMIMILAGQAPLRIARCLSAPVRGALQHSRTHNGDYP